MLYQLQLDISVQAALLFASLIKMAKVLYLKKSLI